MENKSAIDQARAHVPKLVLSHHVHAAVHGDNPIGLINRVWR